MSQVGCSSSFSQMPGGVLGWYVRGGGFQGAGAGDGCLVGVIPCGRRALARGVLHGATTGASVALHAACGRNVLLCPW